MPSRRSTSSCSTPAATPRPRPEQVDAKNFSRILYPDDTTPQGKELRFKQQYFFVSASLQDMLAQHLAEGRGFDALPEAISIQLNDTHPALAIPELMRLLVDDHELEWEKAWAITRRVFSYTNHTLLPEALEVWPVAFFERILPRHLQIIYLINRTLLEEVSAKYPGDNDRRRRMSLIDEGGGRQVRMANMAVVASHTVNGVAKLHSDLMTQTIFADFADFYPGRFTNVTNGIAVRRWLKQSNPGPVGAADAHLGHAWENDLEELERLRWAADDADFRREFREIKLDNKRRLDAEVRRRVGIDLDVNSLFDVQVKRIHEYKRQLLNLLYVVTRYHKLRANPDAFAVPRTVIFAGKAAPGYVMAKGIIKLINNVASVVNADKSIRGKLKVVFLPDYDVSLAQKIMPAADLSEQISTAGLEASGTGNMKLSLNGALTIGTLDGANIEIREQVGPENIFIFGLQAHEVAEHRARGYSPNDYVAVEPGPRPHAGDDRFGLLLAGEHLRRQADRRAPAERGRAVLRAGGLRRLRPGAGRSRRAVPAARRVEPQGRAERAEHGHVLERPQHPRVRGADLAHQAGALTRTRHGG